MDNEICKTCSYYSRDGFCIQNLFYPDETYHCILWTDETLEFDYERVYKLCERYIDICNHFDELEALKKKHPEYEQEINLSDNTWKFFLNTTLNDLKRELGLWRIKQ